MTERLVFMIVDPEAKRLAQLGSSQIEDNLRRRGYQLGEHKIQHYMTHYRVLASNDHPRYRSDSEEIGDTFRYSTEIRWGAASVGHSRHGERINKREVHHIAKIYAEGFFSPKHVSPFFAITQSEEADLVEAAFLALGIKAKKVDRTIVPIEVL